MRKLIIILLLTPLVLFSQKKNTTRYFEAMYFGQQDDMHLKYGTYFFTTKDRGFPTTEEVRALIIIAYKLTFELTNNTLAIIVTEFKNKQEYTKFSKTNFKP